MKQRFLTWLGITLAGFFLGSFTDSFFHSFPVFALAAMFIFWGIGGFASYPKKEVRRIPGKESRNGDEKRESDISEYPLIEADLEKVRKAVKKFADGLPKGVYRTILVQEDNSIDFKQLAHILGGMPTEKFYMSKETYAIFKESDKQIPAEMDKVQKAVDQYVKDNNDYPMLQFDPHHRVNYFQLLQGRYLDSHPEIIFYITDMEGLITHKKPHSKEAENG